MRPILDATTQFHLHSHLLQNILTPTPQSTAIVIIPSQTTYHGDDITTNTVILLFINNRFISTVDGSLNLYAYLYIYIFSFKFKNMYRQILSSDLFYTQRSINENRLFAENLQRNRLNMTSLANRVNSWLPTNQMEWSILSFSECCNLMLIKLKFEINFKVAGC